MAKYDDPAVHAEYTRQWRKKHRDKLNAQARQAYIDRKTLGKRRKTSQYYPSDEQIAEKNKRMAETREILGERIKRLRKERGLTHKYICESLGFSSQQSLVWERSEAAPPNARYTRTCQDAWCVYRLFTHRERGPALCRLIERGQGGWDTRP